MYKLIKNGGVIMQNASAIVYTSGFGFVHKDRPAALSEVIFRPIIEWVDRALDGAGISDRCYVFNEGEDALCEFAGNCPTVFREKESGHPILSAKEWVSERNEKNIIVLSAEAPFITSDIIKKSFAHHIDTTYNLTVLASGGRASFIQELGVSPFWVKGAFLTELFDNCEPEDKDGTQFIPNALKYISDNGSVAGTFVTGVKELNMMAKTPTEILTMNAAARTAVMKKLCDSGVELICTDGIIIDPDAVIGEGTKILPGTIIRGETVIGTNCVIGPNSYIENSIIGDYTEVNSTQIRSSTLGNEVKIGPWSQLRPGCIIHDGCKIGDYVEIKNSEIGARTAIAHLTYIGDSEVGEGVNFGCGCCVANFNGQTKNRTKIGDHAFIGCNTNLIAPVEIGNYAYTAAGTTVNKTVPDYALAVSREPLRIVENWVKDRNAIKER